MRNQLNTAPISPDSIPGWSRYRGLLTTSDMPGTIEIRTYDAPVRFNITIVDSDLCVMQPYLPQARGVESPTFVARRSNEAGIFETFATVFESMWADGRERASE
ncbi:DUF5919 domain-containing protein [Nocardia noduli]|uniref:DUF5919 domain-containing protein n=1 Tax=Nocardia noduli TaxID=2815722 RepID=UPI0034D3DE20